MTVLDQCLDTGRQVRTVLLDNLYKSSFEKFVYNGSVSAATSKFQAAIHKAIAIEIGIHDRGMKRGNLGVLRESNMPAVLIEYAFISNLDDEKILMDKVEQLAQWTANGIVEVVGKCEVPLLLRWKRTATGERILQKLYNSISEQQSME